MDEQLLKDFLATVEKYNYDYDVVMPKFPELQGYDLQLLKDYAATAQKYNYDYSVINPKFPEFKLDGVPALKKKEETLAPTGSDLEASGQPATGTPASESDLTSQPSEPFISRLPSAGSMSNLPSELKDKVKETLPDGSYKTPEEKTQLPAKGKLDPNAPSEPLDKSQYYLNQGDKKDYTLNDILSAEKAGMSVEEYTAKAGFTPTVDELTTNEQYEKFLKERSEFRENYIKEGYIDEIVKTGVSREEAEKNLTKLALNNSIIDPEGEGIKTDPVQSLKDIDRDEILAYRQKLADQYLSDNAKDLGKKAFDIMLENRDGDVESTQEAFAQGMDDLGLMFLSDSQKQVKDLKESIYRLESFENLPEDKKILLEKGKAELKRFIDQGLVGSGDLFNPKTGQFVSGNTKDQEVIAFNKKINEKAAKYDKSDLGELKKERDNAYFKFEKFVDEALDNSLKLPGLVGAQREIWAKRFGLTTPTDEQGINATFTKEQAMQIIKSQADNPFNFGGFDLANSSISEAMAIMNSEVLGSDVTRKAEDLLGEYMALNKHISLNEDPGTIKKIEGFGGMNPTLLGMNLISEDFAIGFQGGLKEGFGGKSMSNLDQSRSAINTIQSMGYDMTDDQKEVLETTMMENVAFGVGYAIPIMGELGVTSMVTGGAGNILRIPQTIKKISGGSKALEKALKFGYGMQMQGLNYELAGQGYVGGVGEFLGESAGEGLIKMLGSNNKLLKALSKVFIGAAGETMAEYSGELAQRLSEDGGSFYDNLQKTIGTPETAGEKIAETYLVSLMMAGTMGATGMNAEFRRDAENTRLELEREAENSEYIKKVLEESKGLESNLRVMAEAEKRIRERDGLEPDAEISEKDLMSEVSTIMNEGNKKINDVISSSISDVLNGDKSLADAFDEASKTTGADLIIEEQFGKLETEADKKAAMLLMAYNADAKTKSNPEFVNWYKATEKELSGLENKSEIVEAALAVQEQDNINQQKQGSQKADIEKRRREELAILDAKQAASEKTGEIPTDENGNAIRIKEEKQKTNSKYDAELAALEQDNINQQKQTDDVQEQQAKDVEVGSGQKEMQELDVEQRQEEVMIDSPFDEDGEIDYEAEEEVREIAKERDLGITRDRNLEVVARDKDGKIIGGAFTSYDNQSGEYTFDVVVSEDAEGKGVGSKLLDQVKDIPFEISDMNPNATIKVDVVNPNMQSMLERRGFEVTEKVDGQGRVIMSPVETNTTEESTVETTAKEKEVAKKYVEELDKTKASNPEAYWSVDSVTEEDAANGTVIDTEDGAAVVSKDGDIKGVFKKLTSKAKGVAQTILKKAVEAGGNKLDNFVTGAGGINLQKTYEKAGFRVASRTPFNEEYAPEGWTEKDGKPDVVAMVYDPNNELDIEEKSFEDYDEMIAHRDSYIKPTESSTKGSPKTESTATTISEPTVSTEETFEVADDVIPEATEGALSLLDAFGKKPKKSKVDPKKRKQVLDQVAKAEKALSKISPNTKIVVHETSKDYKSSGRNRNQNEGGVYEVDAEGNGTIHINLEAANERTVAHEVFHALLLSEGMGDKQAQAITNKMLDAVKKSASPELLLELEEFSKKYVLEDENGNPILDKNGNTIPDPVQSEESIAELFGILASEYETLPRPTQNVIKRWLDKLAKLFGLKLFTDNEVVDMLNTVSKSVREGSVIEESDIEVIRRDPMLARDTRADFLGGIPIDELTDADLDQNQTSQWGESGSDMTAATRKQITEKSIENSRVDDIDTDYTYVFDNYGRKITLPNKQTIKSVLEKSGGYAVFINSDGTKVGVRNNGEMLDGGWQYTFIDENVENNIGFAATSDNHVKTLHKMISELATERDTKDPKSKGKPIAIFVTVQNGETMLGEWYAGEYFFEGIDKAITENKFKNGVDTFRSLMTDALTFKSKINKYREKIRELKNQNQTDETKNKIEVLKKRIIGLKKKSSSKETVALLKLINSDKFKTHDGRIEIAKEFASKKFTFGFRVNLLKTLIPLKSPTGDNLEIKKALLDVGYGRKGFYQEHLDGSLLDHLVKSNYDETSIGGITLGGFYTNPYVSRKDFFDNRKNGIDHAQFNESFSSNGEVFRLNSAHNVNALNPHMGYPTNTGYEVYNKENGSNINKKNASIEQRHDVVKYLDNKYGNKKDGKNLFALPFTSIGGSMYTPTDSEIEFNDSAKKPSRRRKQINPNKRTDRLAPNGNRSNLTNSQYDSVRTPEFKKWFGDWENNPEGASKVVDENGEPLVVYHGSVSTDINEFDRGMSKRKSSGLKEFGTYFTTNEDLAKLYASTEMSNEGKQDKAKKINTIKKKLQSVRNNKEYEALDRELRLLSKDNRIYPVFLNLKKMEVFDAKEDTNIEAWKNLEVKASYKLASGRDAMDFLKEGKFGVQKVDGIKAENIIDMSIGGAYKGSDSYQKAKDKYLSDVYLVFDNQGQNIKLADGTNTTFNPQSRDIRKQKPSDDRPSIEAVREKAKELGVSEKDTEIALRNMGYTNAEIKADKNKSDPFEEEMRGLRKDLGKKEKKSPSKKKILGEPKDKKVTMTERSALKSQIRMEARAARGAVKSYKDASKDLIDHIKELSKTGVIRSSQASVMIKKVLGTNMLNKKAVDKMISYIDKVYSNAELAAMIQAARELSTPAKKNLRGKVGPSKSMQSVLENLFSLDPTMVPMDVFDTYVDLLNQFGKRKAVLDLEESSVVLDKATKVLDAVEESIKETEISETDGTEISETDETTSNEEEVDFDKYAEDVLSEKISMDNLDSKEAKDLAAYLNKLTKKDVEALVIEKKDGSKSYAMLENLRGVKKNMTNGFVPSVALRIKTMVESKKSADKIKSVVESKVKNFNPLTMMSRGYGIIKGKLTGKRSMTESVRGNSVFSIDDILGNFNDKSIHDNTFRKLSTAYSSYQTDMEINVKSKLDAAEKLLHKKNKFFQKLENKVQESKYKLQAYRLQREFESNPESSQVVPAVDFINETIRVIKKDKAGTTLNKNDIRILEKIKEDFGTDGQIDLEKIEKSMTANEKKALKLIDEASDLQSKALWTSAVIRGEKIKPINNYVHHNVKTDSDAETVIEKAKGIMNPSTKAGTLNTRTPGVKAINFDPISSTEMGARQTLLDYHMTESVREVSSTLSQLQKMDYNTDTQQEAINAIDNTVRELLEATLNSQLANTSILDKGLAKIKKLGYQASLGSIPRAALELGSNLMYAITKPKQFVEGVKEFGRFSIGSRGIEAMNNLGSSETMRLYDKHNLTGKMIDSGVLETGARKTTKTRSEIEDKIRYLDNLGPKQVRGLATTVADALISTPDKAVSRPMWFGTFALEFKKLTGETISSKEMDKIADGTSKYLDPKYNESVKEATKVADRELIKMSNTNNPFNSTPKHLPNAADSALKTIYKSANSYMASFQLNEFGTARNAVLSQFQKGDMTKGEAVAALTGITMRMASYMIMYSLATGLFDSMFGIEEEEEKDTLDLIKRQMLGAPVSLITGNSLGNIPRIPINYAVEKFNEKYLEGLRSGEEYDPYKHSLVFSQITEEDLSKKSPEELAIKMFAGPYSPLMSSISRAITVYDRKNNSSTDETKERYQKEWDQRITTEALGNLGYLPLYKDIRRMMLKVLFKDKKKKKKKKK